MSKTATYSLIASTTLGSAATNYTFSSIPGTFTDLIIVATPKSATSAADMYMQFNGDTATNYSWTGLFGTGATAGSTRTANTALGIACNWQAAMIASSFVNNYIINIQDYSNSTTYKTVLTRANSANATTSGIDAITGLWRSTAAITSITLYPNGQNFAIGSNLKLYGIQAGSN